MNPRPTRASPWASPALLLAAVSLILHAVANGHYGIFRDELYYIICGQRADWGYVDHPSIVPLLAAWSHAVFGDSVLGFRLIPALAMTATVALTAEFTRSLGGDRFAQWLAGVCTLLSPSYLLAGVLFTSDMFQPLTWLGLGWVLVQLERTGEERWWLALGAIAGFSLNTKYLIGFYVLALAVGLLATRQRKSLAHPWVYLGMLLAAVMILPNMLWQQAHGWPFAEFSKAASSGKNVWISPPAFLLQQLLTTGPAVALVWLCGLWACLVRPKLAVARAFPIAWLILLLTFDVLHGKVYYLAGIYPTLIAFGAVRIEHWMANTIVRGAALAGVVVFGAVTLPFALPILPVDVFIRYETVTGIMPPSEERQKLTELPQYYADMFGWKEMAEKVAVVYSSLSPEDRARAVFYGNNYGEAAAIDVFGRRLGLPPAISGHNSYYLWGPRGHDGSVIILVGGDAKQHTDLFQSVEIAGRITAAHAMPYETDLPIYVLRGLKQPLQNLWPQVKHYE
jgi:hypothetical protein